MTSRNFSASAFSVPAAREIVRGCSGSRQMNREAMKNIPPADPDRVIAWEPITAVQVVAHRVARRRCFLVIAGVWSLTALASSIMFFSAGAVVGGCTFAATGCLIALAVTACALAWKRHPIPSPKRLYPMMLPQTPGHGWSAFGVITAAWIVLCVASGPDGSLAYAVAHYAVIPVLIGSIVLVPGLVMGSRAQQLRNLLARNPRARQQLDAWAAVWTNPDGARPFGRVPS